MVLGILGLVMCQIVSPFAWAMGKRTLAEIDASGGRLGGRGQAQTGYILGIVGTVLLGVGLLFLVIYFVFVVAGVRRGGRSATPDRGRSERAAHQHRLVDQLIPKRSRTPSRTSAASASSSWVVAPPRLVSASVCFVDSPTRARGGSPSRSRRAR